MVRLIKSNGILFFFFAIYALVAALALLELDVAHYQIAKHAQIQDTAGKDPRGFFGIDLTSAATAWFNSRPEWSSVEESESRLAEMRAILNAGLDGDGPVFRIVLRDDSVSTGSRIVFNGNRPGKLARLNQFSNSLILRNFSHRFITGRPDPRGGNGIAFEIYAATPPGDPAIAELTTRYRWYAMFLLVALTLIALMIARGLVVPVNRVLNSLENSTPGRTVLSRRPRSRLELLYNRMALGAAVSRLQGDLRKEVGANPVWAGWEAVVFIARAFRRQLDLPLIVAIELAERGPGDRTPTGRRLLDGDDDAPENPEQAADAAFSAAPVEYSLGFDFALDRRGVPLDGAGIVLRDPQRHAVGYLLAVCQDASHAVAATPGADALIEALAQLIDAGLESLAARDRLVVAERGRANINLSRSLGHDLTNIIAGAKLEMKTLERFLGAGDLPADPRRREILNESFQGLIKSIRFMQETVNLYRAYAFLQRPALEITDSNALIDETLDLFALSHSGKAVLRRRLDPAAPRCRVDPRLIKLALFNMFANSLKAIRNRDPDTTDAIGWIEVESGASPSGGLQILVTDSGAGIIDAAGRRLPPHEIGKIFELGYTSRRPDDESGEGLGLNWVRTIVTDLHGGEVQAANPPDPKSGARFTLIFPPP